MAPWRGAIWRRTSACARPTARWREARSKTGPSTIPISNRTTRKPNGKWASPATLPNNIFQAPRKKPLPMPPLAPNKEYQILYPAAQRLGLHAFDIPMLRNTVPYNGRRVVHALPLVRGFRVRGQRADGHAQHRHPRRPGHRELRSPHGMHGQRDPPGRAGAVHAEWRTSTPTADFRSRPPDLVIVCGGAIESARLLLKPKHRLFPNGLGNRYDWVGRNLQSHSYSAAIGLFDYETYDDLGPGASIAICDYNHGNPGLAGGAMLANEFIRLPYQFMAQVPAWVRSWGQEHKEFVRSAYKRTIAIQGPVQEMPLFDARIQIDPKVKDHWGIPVARLSGWTPPAHHSDRKVHRWKGGGVAKGGRRHPDLEAAASKIAERRPAPGGYLPDGERPEDLRRRQELQAPRRG